MIELTPFLYTLGSRDKRKIRSLKPTDSSLVSSLKTDLQKVTVPLPKSQQQTGGLEIHYGKSPASKRPLDNKRVESNNVGQRDKPPPQRPTSISESRELEPDDRIRPDSETSRKNQQQQQDKESNQPTDKAKIKFYGLIHELKERAKALHPDSSEFRNLSENRKKLMSLKCLIDWPPLVTSHIYDVFGPESTETLTIAEAFALIEATFNTERPSLPLAQVWKHLKHKGISNNKTLNCSKRILVQVDGTPHSTSWKPLDTVVKVKY